MFFSFHMTASLYDNHLPPARAFAVVESIASKLAIDGGKLYQLSSQQLISCDYKPARNLDGCKGGTIQDALSTIKVCVLARVCVRVCVHL